MNKESILPLLYESIKNHMKKPTLTDINRKAIDKLFSAIDPAIFKKYAKEDIIITLTNILSDKLQKQDEKLQQMLAKKNLTDSFDDMHETLKTIVGASAQTSVDRYVSSYIQQPGPDRQLISTAESKSVEITSFLGISDLPTLQLLFNPSSLYVHYYVMLDSDYRLTPEPTASNVSKFEWNYSETQDLRTGFCNSVGRVRDVIGMRMYQPRVPYLAAMDTSAKRVSVLIEELSAQAFIAENGRRFHFLFRPDYANASGTSIELSTEDYNDGIFSFRKPITTFDSLTISFGDPLTLLSFAKPFDRFVIPIEFTCLKSDK